MIRQAMQSRGPRRWGRGGGMAKYLDTQAGCWHRLRRRRSPGTGRTAGSGGQGAMAGAPGRGQATAGGGV